MQQYAKYLPFLQTSNNKLWCQYALLGAQPIKDLLGDSDHFLAGISLFLFLIIYFALFCSVFVLFCFIVPTKWILGAPYKGSIYEQNGWLNVTAYYAMTVSAYFLRDKKNWLDFADRAVDLVPKLMPSLYKV